MLPFQESGQNNRKWQCFVCGKNFKEYPEYKEHIVTEHEQGREYLVCDSCQAPVRDMKLHYRAKHPNRMLPKGVQARVAVWRDFKSNGEKKRTKKPTFRQGMFLSEKNGVEIPYRSGMECEFLECLEADVDVAAFAYETLKIPYFWQGKWHDYIPDLMVRYIDESVEVWEMKPASQTDYEQNRVKWAAANNYCLNHGWEFIVQTEVALGKLRQKLRKVNG